MGEFIDEKFLRKIKGYKRVAAFVLAYVAAMGALTYDVVATDMELWPKIFLLCNQWSMALAGGLGIKGRHDEIVNKKE